MESQVERQRRRYAKVDSLQDILKSEKREKSCSRARSATMPLAPNFNPFTVRAPSVGGSDSSPKEKMLSPHRFDHVKEPEYRPRSKTSPVQMMFPMDPEEWREVKSEQHVEGPEQEHLGAAEEESGRESSGEDDFAVYSDSGDSVEESALLKGGDYDNDEGLRMKPYRRTPSPEAGVEAGDEAGEGEAVGLASPEAGGEGGDGESGVAVGGEGEDVVESGSVSIIEEADMLTVSGGESGEAEMMWPVAMDDVLAWFVEMSKGGS